MIEGISISVDKVRKSFGATKALNGVSLAFTAGLMHGIIGPEGAGKTTLMRVILGLLKPTEGHVHFRQGAKSIDVRRDPPGHRLYAQQPESLSRSLHRRALEFFQRALRYH